MANLRLKKSILEVVDNQLKANDPPCTKDVYEKLVAAGYSRSEAKDKIGAVALEEIYDILQKGQSFDKEKYQRSLEEMLRQSIEWACSMMSCHWKMGRSIGIEREDQAAAVE